MHLHRLDFFAGLGIGVKLSDTRLDHLEFGFRLAKAHSISQAGDDAVVDGRRADLVVVAEFGGNPDLRFLRVEGKLKGPGHHTDDGIRLAIDANDSPQNIAIRAEGVTPDGITQNDSFIVLLVPVVAGEVLADCGPDPKRPEKIFANGGRVDLHRTRIAFDVRRGLVPGVECYGLESAAALAPLLK